MSATSGVATFGGLSVARPGEGFSLEATATGLAAGESEPFAVHLTFVQTSAGNDHTCAATTFDKPFCWGDNISGQLGEGTTENRAIPVRVVQ